MNVNSMEKGQQTPISLPERRTLKDSELNLFQQVIEKPMAITQREDLWSRYRKSDNPDPEIKKQLFQPVTDRLIATFGGRQLPVVPGLEQLELRALIREFDMFSSRHETVLLEVARSIRGEDGSLSPDLQLLNDLISRELITLIPKNSMINNILRNSHKLDLEE